MTIAAIFLPLLGAFIAGFFGRWIGDRGAQLVTCLALVIAAVLGGVLFVNVALHGHGRTIDLFTWIDTGDLQIEWAVRYDTLSAVMVGMARLGSAVGPLFA